MKTQISLGILMSFLLIACNSGDIEKDLNDKVVVHEKSLTQDLNRDIRSVILGSKKVNPYTVKNMNAALDTLRAHPDELGGCLRSASSLDDITISTTDLYVRFLPSDSLQFSRLKKDTTLTLFDYPLDYSISQIGDYYFDPSVTGPYTWLYTRVPVGYNPPIGITYEVLDELFLYENSPYYTEEIVASNSSVMRISRPKSVYLEDALKTIEAISFFNTGNPYGKTDVGGTSSNGMRKIRKQVAKHFLWKTWYEYEYFPSGNLFVNSNHTMNTLGNTTHFNYGRAPLKGVKVHFINWFKWNSVYTNQDGYYESDVYYNGDPTYSIYFEGKNNANSWQLDRVTLGALCLWVQKYSMGEHSKDGYSTTIDSTCGAWDACLTNNAIYEYMTVCDILGLTRPTNNLQVALRNSTGPSSAPLLQNHLSFYKDEIKKLLLANFFTGQNFMIDLTYWSLFSAVPDLIISGGELKRLIHKVGFTPDESISHFHSTIWHELSHASAVRRLEIDKGSFVAYSYWSSLVGTEMGHCALSAGTDFYGKKFDSNWEQVAICEGWASYREFIMADDYLSGYDPFPSGTSFPEDFFVLFNQLQVAGCQLPVLEKAISNKTLSEVEVELKKSYPNLETRITSLFNQYE